MIDCRGLLAFGDVAADTRRCRSVPPPAGSAMGAAYEAVDAATLHLKFETLTLGCTFYIDPGKIPDKVSCLTSVSIWIVTQ